MNVLKRLLKYISIAICISICMLPAGIAHAIVNPDSIEFGSGISAAYKIFYNTFETGDWWIIAEGFVDYTTEPTDYTASEAFTFSLLNVDGDTTYAQTNLNAYGDRPISIYLSAAQVTALGLSTSTDYMLQITGNPAVFASGAGNTVNATVSGTDFIDQSTSTNTTNHLRIFMINMMQTIETEDSPTDDYVITSNGIKYISTAGADIALVGVPNLDDAVPSLFTITSTTLSPDTPTAVGTYSENLTVTNRFGTLTANGITNLSVWFGFGSDSNMGGVILIGILVCMFAIWAYRKTESGLVVVIIIAVTPLFASYMGFIDLALAMVVTIVLAMLSGYFFFKAGAL